MRILLAQKMTYLPAHGGANKGNRLLMEALAERGHTCQMVALATSVQGYGTRQQLLEQLAARGIRVDASEAQADSFTHHGVGVHVVADKRFLCNFLVAQIRRFEPTWVLVSSEDAGQTLLAAALGVAGGRVVYLARTTSCLPFGPSAYFANSEGAELLGRTAGIVTVNRHLKEYIGRWGGMEATHIPISAMTLGRGPFPWLASFDNDYVTMLNPCAIKGISIFLDLARALPHIRFAAVPTWGTTSKDITLLRERSNITLLDPVDDIEQIFARTRALLMPSLWEEAFGRAAAEAMLRGVPVLASDVGGLPESKLGIDYILPVRPITAYGDMTDDKMKPVPTIPEQDIQPWCEALQHLLSDGRHYRRLSLASREAAHIAYASDPDPVRPFERFLEQLTPREPRRGARDISAEPRGISIQRDLAGTAHLTAARRRFLALRAMRERRLGTSETLIRCAERDRPLPLSSAQERLWFLQQLSPDNSAYNLPIVLRLHGRLDAGALEQSLNEIVNRHEALRTTFEAIDGVPAQVIAPRLHVPLTRMHFDASDSDDREEEIRRRVAREVRRPFDLARGPLIRAVLLGVADTEHILTVVMHHMVSDGWSLRVFRRELSLFYGRYAANEPLSLPELPIQYADYACWERRLMAEVPQYHLEYWKGQLEAVSHLELPTDYARPPTASHRGAKVQATLDAPLTRALRAISRESKCTLFVTLLAAFNLLLHRLAGQDDICVGVPVVNRNRPELENLIGFFINTLVIRTHLSGNPTFRELLSRVRDVVLEAYAHQELSLERLVQEMAPERHADRSPFFQTFLNVHGPESEPFALHNLDVSSFASQSVGAKFDLTLHVREDRDQLQFQLVYSTDLFRQDRATAMLDQFVHLLMQLAAGPLRRIGEFTLVTPAIARVVPAPTESLPCTCEETTICTPVAAQAEAEPERVAIVGTDSVWTYADLDVTSDWMAASLQMKGLEPGAVVAIYGCRSASMVCAMLGVLKAGGAFLLLDPAYPVRRLVEYMHAAQPSGWLQLRSAGAPAPALQDAARSIRCHVQWPEGPQGRAAPAVRGAPSPDSAAYVVFTSGSTHDKPRGILGTHRPVSHFLQWHCRTFGLHHLDRFALLSGLSHDPLLRDVFTPLWLGATLYVPHRQNRDSPWRIWDWMCDNQITVVHITPRMAEVIATAAAASDGPREIASLRYVFFGGDVLTRRCVAHVRRFAPRAICVNFYGATETPQAIACHIVYRSTETDGAAPGGSLPIGRGIEGVQLLIVNNAGQLAGIGEKGEIHVRSRYLSQGYINDARATAEKYILSPFTGRADDRVYKTGDLGRYLPDGSVEFCGRGDRQVKVRGFRIEPTEIESALLSHPAVQQAVVTAAGPAGADQALAAFVVCRSNVSTLALRRHLRGLLPDHMVPDRLVVLDSLPLTANGKIDAARLPLSAAIGGEAEQSVPPRTPMECAVAAIWREVIGVPRIGIHDNFFDLGGHSLLVVKAVFQIKKRLGLVIPFRAFFNQTLAQFAADCDRRAAARVRPCEEAAGNLPRG